MFRDAFGMGDGRRSRPRQPQSDERLVALGLVLLIWALVVAGRLFGLQVVHHEVYRNLAESQQDKLEKIEARRGSIFVGTASATAGSFLTWSRSYAHGKPLQ